MNMNEKKIKATINNVLTEIYNNMLEYSYH